MSEGLQLHPRALLVHKAETEFSHLTMKFMQKHPSLTYVEWLQILQHEVSMSLKYMLREERHPGDPDKKADEV